MFALKQLASPNTGKSTGPSSGKVGTILKATCAAALLAVSTVGVLATPASAAQASALGCQTTYARLTSTGGSVWGWSCSGSKPVNVYARSFSAGGWSGGVYTYDRGTFMFCDFDTLTLNGAHVYEVFLNATRPSRCN
jgi:hypothetical protein